MFHLYLPTNVFSQLIQPVVQLLALVAVPVLIIMGIGTGVAWASGLPSIWIVLGFSLSLFNIILALLLDKAWRDFRHLIVVPLPLPFSLFLSCVTVAAIWKEFTGQEQKWNKLERTGLQTVNA
ncbi:hypothetical protein [Flaviflexus sp.]|uniref:hypothetical protein n=1 Tax=Flaviflexus sp. TaxID=1969482 RepID=UPI003F93DFE3